MVSGEHCVVEKSLTEAARAAAHGELVEEAARLTASGRSDADAIRSLKGFNVLLPVHFLERELREAWESAKDGHRGGASGAKTRSGPPAIRKDAVAAFGALPKTPKELHFVGLFEPSDAGNGERFAAHYAEDFRYVHSWRKFLRWNGRYWEEDALNEARLCAKNVGRIICEEAKRAEDDKQFEALLKWARQSVDRRRIDAMLVAAAAEEGIAAKPEAFDDPETTAFFFNAANGLVDLTMGNVLSHDRARELLITQHSPANYDRAATCPLWLAFLDRVLDRDTELISFLQRLCGYLLTGTTREQRFFIFDGPGANGKTVCLSTLLHVLGSYGRVIPSEVLVQTHNEQHPAGVALLHGARLAAAAETERGQRLAESRVKQLSGSDRLVARRMHQDWWEFTPSHKLLLSTNHKPRIEGDDLAIWRRVCRIPFQVIIPIKEQDKALVYKLQAERDGILAWMVAGCTDWLERGDLGEPAVVKVAVESYRKESDAARLFLAECADLGADRRVLSAELWQAFEDWLRETGEEAISRKEFGQRLGAMGFEAVRVRGQRWWGGLSVRRPES